MKKLQEEPSQHYEKQEKRGVQLGVTGSQNIKKANEERIKQANEYANQIKPIILPLRKQGFSYKEIANRLNVVGISTPRGKCLGCTSSKICNQILWCCMTEIDWKQELLESGRFNKFQEKLLKNGAKNFMQGVYLGWLYNRYRKLKGLNINDPKENTGQLQSNYKEWSKSSQQQEK